MFQRWRDSFNAQQWEAMRALYSPEMYWEDRRRFAQVSGDLELLLSSILERASVGARSEGKLVGVAGDRIAIVHAMWSGGPPEGRFEIECLSVIEVDEAGLNKVLINFDVEDARAALGDYPIHLNLDGQFAQELKAVCSLKAKLGNTEDVDVTKAIDPSFLSAVAPDRVKDF